MQKLNQVVNATPNWAVSLMVFLLIALGDYLRQNGEIRDFYGLITALVVALGTWLNAHAAGQTGKTE